MNNPMQFFQRNFFWIIMIVFIGRRFLSGAINDPKSFIAGIIFMIPGIIIGITVHEFAHAYSAYKLGDNTPKNQGRVTLNPLAHIDPLGMICLFLGGFGWGKPVEVNPYNFKNQKRDDLIVDISGVITNLIFAIIFTGVFKIYMLTVSNNMAFSASGTGQAIATIIHSIIQINLVLMIFNLIPVPPLDGFGIVTNLFDLRRNSWYGMLYQYGNFILLALIFFGVTSKILGPILSWFLNTLYTIFGIIR